MKSHENSSFRWKIRENPMKSHEISIFRGKIPWKIRAEKLKEGLQVIIRAVETALRQGLIGVVDQG